MKAIKWDIFFVGLNFLLLSFSSFVSTSFLDKTHFIFLSLLAIVSVFYLRFKYLDKKQQEDFLFKSSRFINNVAGTSDQINGSCVQISETSNEQSSAVIQTGTASDEISAMISRNSDSIEKVNRNISSINDIVKVSSGSLNDLENSMEKNSHANEEVIQLISVISSRLEELLDQFKEVVDKTAVINDIVFQTKLLSFNASVEAARAGEHGKGFSVVAQEIGNLASMSGESATAIQSTLEVTDTKVKTILEEIEAGSQKMTSMLKDQDKTLKLVLGEFNQNFEKVISQIKETVTQTQEISEASREQNKGVDEMRDGIYTVSESIQRNTLVVGQTTNLAVVLNKEVLNYKELLNEFKVASHSSANVQLELIPWDNKYAIGVSQMDHEHQVLLDKINELIFDMNERQDHIPQSFEELKRYTIEHFTHEEAYMEEIGYKSLESHKRVHKNLLEAVTKFESQLKQGALDRPKLASFLKNWLFTHIMGVDTKYAEHGKLAQDSNKKAA